MSPVGQQENRVRATFPTPWWMGGRDLSRQWCRMNEFDDEVLERLVRRHLPDAPGIGFESIRTGKFNKSFFVQAGEQDLVLRIAPSQDAVLLFYERDMMRQEPQIHQLLRDQTSVPMASILAYDDSHSEVPHHFMIMERLPGVPLTEAPGAPMDSVLHKVGEHLAQAHAQEAEHYGYIGAHRPMPPQPSWTDAFVMMWRKLVEDIAGVGFYDQDEQRFVLDLLDRYISVFERPVPSRLLHMDIWHQNILVDPDSGAVTGIVDWDRALWGDTEIEFAVLDYCGISEPAFWEGYGSTRDASDEARVRQLFYLAYEVQKYIVIQAGRFGDRASAGQYKAQSLAMLRQLA